MDDVFTLAAEFYFFYCMTEEEKISVILPAYNEADTIGDVIAAGYFAVF